MSSPLFWLLFLCWASLCLFLDQMSRTPIFRIEDVAEPDQCGVENTNPTA